MSEDGRRLAAGLTALDTEDYEEVHAVAVWNTETGACEAILDQHEEQVAAVAFSPDGNHVASGAWDGVVLVHTIDPKAARAAAARGPERLSIDLESVHTRGAYAGLLGDFADLTGGALVVSRAAERWAAKHVELDFEVAGRQYEAKLDRKKDWIDLSFVDALNQALEDDGLEERFVEGPVEYGYFVSYEYRIPE